MSKKAVTNELLKEIDKAASYHYKYLKSIQKIEEHFFDRGMLRDGDDRGIYLGEEYICDMSFFEDPSGMTSAQFLELFNKSI